jgi:hypothetical protein
MQINWTTDESCVRTCKLGEQGRRGQKGARGQVVAGAEHMHPHAPACTLHLFASASLKQVSQYKADQKKKSRKEKKKMHV